MNTGEPIRNYEMIEVRLQVFISVGKEIQHQQEMGVYSDAQALSAGILRQQVYTLERQELKKDLKWLIDRLARKPGIENLPSTDAMTANTLIDRIIQVI